MFIPTYFAEQARRAWRLPRVRRFVWVYLVSLVVLALLQGCGGGDPEPADERVTLPTKPAREAAQ